VSGSYPISRVVLATHNAHKVGELQAILGQLVPGIEVLGYEGPEPVEDGETFEANALIKARAAAAFTGLPAIADDSGICVDALDGEPGIHSARYAGTRIDKDNRDLLLANLGDTLDRSAQFVCAAALVRADGSEVTELASWPGTILAAEAGEGGFGYDPIFAPDGFWGSAAEMTVDEKNAHSHRAMAFAALAEHLR
jgi:XTP/dITP diphosphohydrolase